MSGRRILITREKESSASFAERLTALGYLPIEIPLIRIYPVKESAALQQVFTDIHGYDWLLFTSANGVKAFFYFLERFGIDMAKVRGKAISVGPKTSKALQERGYPPFIEAKEFRQEGLIEALKGKVNSGDSFLFLRGNLAREVIGNTLRDWGVRVDEAIVYENYPDEEGGEKIGRLIARGEIDLITFTSPSTFQALYDVLRKHGQEALLHQVKIASIGPVTSERIRALGYRVEIEAKVYTVEGLIAAIQESMGR